jgi:hypothetical protein
MPRGLAAGLLLVMLAVAALVAANSLRAPMPQVYARRPPTDAGTIKLRSPQTR